jgi:glucosamine--fructose-6-phosphate aminotransferase (isomerizing)
MAVDLSVIEGNYFRDLLDQPKALQDTLDGLDESKQLNSLAKRLRAGKFRTVVLTGMGSSFHGLNPLLLQLTEPKIPVSLVETSELIYYRRNLLDPRSLVIAVSQSGHSAEIIRLLELNRLRFPIIAVTNTADSPLARRSEAAVITRAGEEFSVSCKTYVTSLLALKFLGDRLCGVPLARTRRELKSVLSPVAHYLAAWKQHFEHMLPKLGGIRQLFLAGRGPSLASVGTGALILKECTQFPSEGLSSAAFRHGPFEMVGPKTFVLVFAGASKTQALNKRLFVDVRERNGRAEYVDHDSTSSPFSLPKVLPSLLPIVEILPVQMMTLAIAAMTGRKPGQFRFATKITSTE